VTIRRLVRRRVPLVGALAAVLAGCIDFGDRVEPPSAFEDAGVDAGPPDAGPPFDAGPQDAGPPPPDGASADDAGDDASPPCVEEAVPPSDTGPQLQIVTLNVDRPALTIMPGDVLTWTNADTDRHTATAGAPGAILPAARGGFDSGEIAPSGRWAYRFCNPRTVTWFCQNHAAQMNGYRITIGG